MPPFELLFRDIKTNDLTTSQSSSIKYNFWTLRLYHATFLREKDLSVI